MNSDADTHPEDRSGCGHEARLRVGSGETIRPTEVSERW